MAVRKTTSMSKDVFGHWTVIAVFILIFSITVTLIRVREPEKKIPAESSPIIYAELSDYNTTTILPPIMQQTLNDDVEQEIAKLQAQLTDVREKILSDKAKAEVEKIDNIPETQLSSTNAAAVTNQ